MEQGVGWVAEAQSHALQEARSILFITKSVAELLMVRRVMLSAEALK
jgi:hypothetical protein